MSNEKGKMATNDAGTDKKNALIKKANREKNQRDAKLEEQIEKVLFFFFFILNNYFHLIEIYHRSLTV